MSRILITGATGFVGGAVIRALREQGHALSGTTRQADLSQGPGGVPLYYVSDLAEDADWSRVVAGADVVIHLAARAHVMGEHGVRALNLYRAANRHGSVRLAEAAAAAGVKRFVFMSSVKAAGEETFGQPLRETDVPHPEDAYGISKWEAERALRDVAERTKLELVIMRPPLVYGPGVKGNFLTLLKACARGWPLPLAGIDNRRSLVSSTNLAAAVAACAVAPRAAGATFFVADGEDISTPALLRRLARSMGCEARLFAVPSSVMALARRLPKVGDKVRRLAGSLQLDSQAIRTQIGWVPPQTLDAGLAETAAWYLSAQAPRR